MSNREETSGPTQDTLEGLYLSDRLGTPWNSPGGAGGSGWGEGRLGFFAEAAASATRTRISGRRRVRVQVRVNGAKQRIYIRENGESPTHVDRKCILMVTRHTESLKVRLLPPWRVLLPVFPPVFPRVGRFSRFPWGQRSPRSAAACSATSCPATACSAICTSGLPGVGGRLPSLWRGFRRPALQSTRRRRTGSFLHGRLVPTRRGHGTRLQRHA